ncbi:unnamed protein product, partial [Onchocerca ochengi]|uniref:PH domain-containing protein n=1 Tax=Onchocerca ochengi TaxID=42157 RepID=A0A182EVA5_ONCOC
TKHWEAAIPSSSANNVRFPSRHRLKRSTTATTTPISASTLSAPIRVDDVQKQGQLMHQEMALGEPLKNDRHKWSVYWAVLYGTKLYLCSQLSSHISDETHEKV